MAVNIRLRLAVAGAFIAAALGAAPVPAHASDAADGLTYRDCHELVGFQKTAIKNVDPFVPDRYGLDPDSPQDGLASFYISTRWCEEIEVDGVVVPGAIDSHISIFVDPPEHAPHASMFVPGLPFEVYLLQWITNNKPFETWMKHGTGLADKVKYVPDIILEHNPVPEHNHDVPGAVDDDFRLVVPDPAPSPFHIDQATVHEPTGWSPMWTSENWWADTARGTVIVHAAPGDNARWAVGRAKATVTVDDSKSPLAHLFRKPAESSKSGSGSSRPLCSDENGDPDLSCPDGVDVVGSGFFTEVLLTKCLRTSPDDCAPEGSSP